MTSEGSRPPGAELSARERGHGRDRALLGTLLGSAGLQVVTVVASIVSLPFVTRSLSTAEFGVLSTLTAFYAFIGLADVGVGASLTIKLADALGRRDEASVGRLVAASLLITAGAGLLVAAIGAASAWILPWSDILGAEDVDSSEISAAVIAMSVSLACAIVGSVGYRMLFAVQRGGTASRMLVISAVASAAAQVLASVAGAPLWVFVVAAMGVPAAAAIVLTAFMIRPQRSPTLSPRPSHLRVTDISSLLGNSSWFWLVSLCAAMGFQADTLIVAGVLGASAAAVFSMVVRLLGLINQTIQPSVLQLAPAFADALAQGDGRWVKRRLRSSMLTAALLATAMGTGLVVLGPPIVEFWLTPELVPPRSVLLVAAVWQVYILASEPLLLLLQAMGRVRTHAAMALAMLSLNVPLSILLTHEWGLAGPLVGSILATLLCVGVPSVVFVQRAWPSLDVVKGPSPVGHDTRRSRYPS